MSYTPPIYPSGVNSIEARVKALEVAKGYDAQTMQHLREEIGHLRYAITELHDQAEALQRKAAAWVISALLAAVTSLILIVIKLKAPWMLTP